MFITFEYSLGQDISMGSNIFSPVTLALEIGLLFEIYNLYEKYFNSYLWYFTRKFFFVDTIPFDLDIKQLYKIKYF